MILNHPEGIPTVVNPNHHPSLVACVSAGIVTVLMAQRTGVSVILLCN